MNSELFQKAIEDVKDSAGCFEYYATLADDFDANRSGVLLIRWKKRVTDVAYNPERRR